jgi:hypothetical protein
VGRAEAASWGINRPDGVTLSFQVRRNKVEPSESVIGRNLFAKDWDRVLDADEAEEFGPEMTFIGCAGSFSGNRERLTRARSRPDALFVRPACAPEGVTPDSNSGEEMALGKASEVCGLHVLDVSSINFPRRYDFRGHQVLQPFHIEAVVLVVVSVHNSNSFSKSCTSAAPFSEL